MSPGGATIPLLLLAILLVSAVLATDGKGRLDNVSFNNEDEQFSNEKLSTSLIVEGNFWKNKTTKIHDDDTSQSIKKSQKREEIGQVQSTRNMSPPQKLVMSTQISSRMSSNESSYSPYEVVRSLVGRENQDNVTGDSMLPISMDISRIFSEDENNDETPEELPEAQELRSARPTRGRRPYYRPQSPSRRPPALNRRNVFPAELSRPSSKRPTRRPTETNKEPSTSDCTFFSKTVCLQAVNYPHEAIMRSIRGNKEMVSALLTDYKSQEISETENRRPSALPLHNRYDNRYENRFENNEIKRRADYPSAYDNVEEGFTCPSSVMYARPQLARAVSGMWKYIINTGEHTQTLRLEKCSHPKSSCSFISENYRSSCTQVYNYHRLLTWDSSLGLHMDIFKVPTCCSCHVHGYSVLYPPNQKDPPSSIRESFPGAEFATENQASEQEEYPERPSSYLTKFKPSATIDNNFVSNSKKPLTDAETSNRPSYAIPGRRKKPQTSSRPFDKLPQQHAPNTRAPGYKGPILKPKRPARPNRPFRRESNSDVEETSSTSVSSIISSDSSSSMTNWFSQPFDEDSDASTRLHNGGFDEEYQEPHRRVNYNYHPIIDFFKPEASMLQSAASQTATQAALAQPVSSDTSWKPMYSV